MTPALEDRIRSRGLELGFERVAFSTAGRSPRAEAFRRWLERGFAGEMAYLERDPARREDVTLRSPWARTIVSVSLNYAPFRERPDPQSGRTRGSGAGRPGETEGIAGLVSRYAVGRDYHDVLGERLGELAHFLKTETGGRAEARVLVDTSAILERDQAAAAGIGWTGKNAMVIDPHAGSYLFLGEIVTDRELTPGPEMEDLCGACTRCLDACPTGAIVEPRVVDARRCISYLTIELRGAVPENLRSSIGEHLFGCDVCQEVCPWNRQAPETHEAAFRTGRALEEMSLEEAVQLDAEAFAVGFRGSAIARAKRSGFVRNALIVAGNRRDGPALRAGRAALDDPAPVVRETAVWALGRGEEPERRLAALRAEKEPDPAVRTRMLDALARMPSPGSAG